MKNSFSVDRNMASDENEIHQFFIYIIAIHEQKEKNNNLSASANNARFLLTSVFSRLKVSRDAVFLDISDKNVLTYIIFSSSFTFSYEVN